MAEGDWQHKRNGVRWGGVPGRRVLGSLGGAPMSSVVDGGRERKGCVSASGGLVGGFCGCFQRVGAWFVGGKAMVVCCVEEKV